MKILDLIKQYREKLNNNPNDISCLSFALQIPSICSRIEFSRTDYAELYKKSGIPNDGKMYKAWLCKYSSYFEHIYISSVNIDDFCENVYNLRCNFVHEGILMTDENTKFYFVDSDSSMSINDIIFVSIYNFCESMFDAAEKSLKNKGISKTVTVFDNVSIDSNTYFDIRNDVVLLYKQFWSKYDKSDKDLMVIYHHIAYNNVNFETLKCEIDDFFELYPNDIYKLLHFYMKFGCRLFNNTYVDNFGTLCLSKSDYERMLQIHKELDDFSKEHPFDINKYTN